MKNPVEMHPRIFERRKAVSMDRLECVPPEKWPAVVSAWVSNWERQLPLPENYRKKPLPRLWKILRMIDENLSICAIPGQGEVMEKAAGMYQRHRGYVVKELHRRMIVKETNETA